MEDLVELIDVVATLEERTTTKKLSENTANGPNVDWKWVSPLEAVPAQVKGYLLALV